MSAFGSKPGDEADVDREIRIERMKRELADLSGGSMITGSFEELSPDLEEVFWARVCEFEKAAWDKNFDRLVELGVQMVPPSELDDETLRRKLNEVIQTLATIRCFLEQTDHLSDRELYTWLWSDGLREETPDLSRLGGAWHISPIGSCNEEDTAIFLRYYADEKERRSWQQEFPNDSLPPHCSLPYDRDRSLPRLE